MRLAERVGFELTEDLLFRYVLRGRVGLGRLKRAIGGYTLGDIEWGRFLHSRLTTPDRRIALAPPEFVSALGDAIRSPPAPSREYPMLLISGARRSASYNTWTHNLPELMKALGGNWATLHPSDAARLEIADGDTLRIITETGIARDRRNRVSRDIREGVVAVHQFWGHHYDSSTRTSRSRPGVNVNLVHDDRDLDRFSYL